MISYDEIFPAEVVEVQGKPYLFANCRVRRDTIPENLYVYDVRDNCDGAFWKVKPTIIVNHWATIIGLEPIEMDGDSFECQPDEVFPELSSEGCFIGYDIKDLDDFIELTKDI